LQLKALAEEQLAVVKGLEKVEQELTASESDGPVSDVFRKVYCHNFLCCLEFLLYLKCFWWPVFCSFGCVIMYP
jgi:formin 2